jgi:hypothetical protein
MKIEEFLASIPEERRSAILALRNTILENIPSGFEERISPTGITFVVPLEKFPAGYHTKANTPLAMIWISNEKNYISLHHLGLYGNKELLDWFTSAYAEQVPSKLDMGKGCVRFKKMDQIPYELVTKLVKKISVERWIEIYTTAFSKRT